MGGDKDSLLFHVVPPSARLIPSHRSAVVCTLCTLCDITQQASSVHVPETGAIALLPPGLTAGELSHDLRDYLEALTVSANTTANSLACGSILAGQTSESDEYGDVAVWLGEGDFGAGHEVDVVKALQLATQDPKAVGISSSTHLPSSVRLSPTTPETQELIGLLSRLTDMYAFTTQSPRGIPGPLVYFLLGRYVESGGKSGWVGLVGISIASDF